MAAPQINTQRLFTGFSTISDNPTNLVWTYYDIELIKRDLYNHFYTRIGERVMRPDFGCRIWDYMMEQFTPAIEDAIISECIKVVNAQYGRVEIAQVTVTKYDQGIRVEMQLNYVPFNVIGTFTATFEQRQAALTGDSLETY